MLYVNNLSHGKQMLYVNNLNHDVFFNRSFTRQNPHGSNTRSEVSSCIHCLSVYLLIWSHRSESLLSVCMWFDEQTNTLCASIHCFTSFSVAWLCPSAHTWGSPSITRLNLPWFACGAGEPYMKLGVIGLLWW